MDFFTPFNLYINYKRQELIVFPCILIAVNIYCTVKDKDLNIKVVCLCV